MRFFWTEEKIQLYKRAAEFTGYCTDLSDKIIEEIGEDNTIYDIGCGMSYLSMNLANHSKKIYCVDIQKLVVDELNKEIKDREIENIRTLTSDYREFLSSKEKVNCIIASHFLDMEKNLDFLLDKCNCLVIIKNTKERRGMHGFKKQYTEEVEDMLQNKNIKYEKFIHSGEFGQPLKSVNEAVEYYNSYSSEKTNEREIKELLIENNSWEYPYYLPKYKDTGILVIKKENV